MTDTDEKASTDEGAASIAPLHRRLNLEGHSIVAGILIALAIDA